MAAARCVLALACLVFQLFLAPVDFIWFTMAIALFAASSLVAVMRAEIFDGAFGLLALFIDTVFFMLLARYGANETLWLHDGNDDRMVPAATVIDVWEIVRR